MKYTKICRYCGESFRTNWQHQEYCTPTHKSYDYRRRKREADDGKVCPKCFRPWTEPDVLKSDKPRYCAQCQTYYRDRYRKMVDTSKTNRI